MLLQNFVEYGHQRADLSTTSMFFHDDVIKWNHFRVIPTQRPVTRSFDVFFDLGLNKRLNKHSRRRALIWDAIALIMTSLRCFSMFQMVKFVGPDLRIYLSVSCVIIVPIACRLFGTHLLLNKCWLVVNRTSRNIFQWNCNQNAENFCKEMHFKSIICKMSDTTKSVVRH